MPFANSRTPIGFAAARMKRMRRLSAARTVGFSLSEIGRAASLATAQAGMECLIRNGEALLQRRGGAAAADEEVAPEDELASLEPLTTD